jgi:uncharacterized membrane protein
MRIHISCLILGRSWSIVRGGFLCLFNIFKNLHLQICIIFIIFISFSKNKHIIFHVFKHENSWIYFTFQIYYENFRNAFFTNIINIHQVVCFHYTKMYLSSFWVLVGQTKIVIDIKLFPSSLLKWISYKYDYTYPKWKLSKTNTFDLYQTYYNVSLKLLAKQSQT